MIQLPLKKTILSLFFSSIVSMTISLYSGMPMPNNPAFQLSQQQIDQMTKELENIDKFFNSLSPEEQAEFLKQVDEAQKMLNNMSEEELNQLVKEMEQFMPEVFGGIPGEAFKKPLTQPEEIKPLETPIIKPEPTENLTEKEFGALNVIDLAIKNINECIVKINSAPELPVIIERWASRKKISHWPANKKWSEIYSDLDLTVKKLSELKEKDPTNNSYRHLKTIADDQALLEIIKELASGLEQLVHAIIIPTFGIIDMKKEAKKALKDSISLIIKTIYDQELVKKIDALLQKFLPEAEKIKTAEAKIKSRAEQQAQAKPQQGKTIVAGRPNQERDSMGSNFYDNNGYYGNDRSSYYGGTDNYSTYDSSSTNNKTKMVLPSSKGGSSAPSSSSSIPSGSSKNNGAAKEKNPHEKNMTTIIDLIGDTIDIIEDDPLLSNLEKHLKNNSEAVNAKTISNIARIERNITEATSKVQSFNRKVSESGELGKKYKAELKKKIEKYRGPLNKLKNSINNSKSYINNVLAEKRYGYFKETVIIPKDKQIPQSSTSLKELADTINKFNKIIDK